MLFIFTKFHENISNGFRVRSGQNFQSGIFKGHNFVKNVGGVLMMLFTKFHENTVDSRYLDFGYLE